jgi:hypothetical protein
MQKQANKVRFLTFYVILEANKRDYKLLTQNTALENAQILSIRTRRAGANRRSPNGVALANDVNFDAAFVTLKRGSEEVFESMPVEHIERATLITPEKGFEINWTGIDWNTTKLIIAQDVAINTGAAFEFTVEYIQN